MNTKFVTILAFSLGLLALPSACSDVTCDSTLTRTDPTDPTKEVHLVVGTDGLCHWPWYDEETWGQKCEQNEDCGQMLLCLAPDLPICTQINCDPDPKKDDVCGPGFMCISTGGDQPTVCIPQPMPPAGSGGSSSATGGSPNLGGGAGAPPEGGMGGADSGSGGSTAPTAANIGTPCTEAGDPVCEGGTFCENTSLGYCTVMGCASSGDPKDACDGVAAQGFTCMAGAPFPDAGICYNAGGGEPSPNIGTACSAADDPVCVGGTFCENTNLGYCTVAGCAAAGDAKDACDGATSDGFMCMAGAPFPDAGICYKP
jgi:hypothetical protein